MARCRIPVVAAVNGPAVGLGCSLVALSDIVYIAEDAYLADPHVQVGLVAADGGPLTWPLHISLLLAKEYALTGARIPAAARRRARPGQPRRRRPAGRGAGVREEDHGAAAAGRREHQAVAQHCISNAPCWPRLDYANAAEDQSFQTEDFREIVTRLNAKK